MKLTPLRQWICDECGQLIEKPKDGWVHWYEEEEGEGRFYGFTILHHFMASPRGGERGCYPEDMEMDMHLHHMIGTRGLIDLMSMVDVGPYHDPARKGSVRVRDIGEWVRVGAASPLPIL